VSEQPFEEPPRSAQQKRLVYFLLLLAVPLGGYYGLAAWKHYTTHVSTDNAYVQADTAQITPRVPGTVTEVLVHDNWWVKPGQVLVRLDTQEYEVRLAEARAALTRAHETVDQLFAAVAVANERRRATQEQIQAAQAEVAEAQAEFHQAKLDLQRAAQLAEEQIIPIQRFDQAKTRYATAQSRLHAKQQYLEETKKNEATRRREADQARAALGDTVASERAAHSLIKQAETAVREAELSLSYCIIAAPLEGMVSRKAIEIGQRVQPGQALMALIPLHKIYKESPSAHARGRVNLNPLPAALFQSGRE
jgi:membrane fusion protein (multidrug efflux system)